jgi:hypothetical protein
MAIYYSIKGKAGLSLFFWGCSVGCRPFQVIYIFVLAYFLYKKFREDTPGITIKEIAVQKWKCLIPVFLIALSYMVLNYARFGSITEFGHDYLPEFTSSQNGQFSFSYIKDNMIKLFRIPEYTDGKFSFPTHEGFNVFMVSPMFIVFIVAFIYAMVENKKYDTKINIMIMALVIIHILLLTAHRTMGGEHFGNRYPCDALPYAFTAIAIIIPEKSRCTRLCMIPLMFGFALNALGVLTGFVK